jgi:hypothetical protein
MLAADAAAAVHVDVTSLCVCKGRGRYRHGSVEHDVISEALTATYLASRLLTF